MQRLLGSWIGRLGWGRVCVWGAALLQRVRGGPARSRLQRRLPAGGQQRHEAAQFVVDQVAQRGLGLLQVGALVAQRQPGFAPRQHGLQQLAQARRLVVEALEHAL